MSTQSALNPMFEAVARTNNPHISDIVELLHSIDRLTVQAQAALASKEELLFKQQCDAIASAAVKLEHDYKSKLLDFKNNYPEQFPILMQLIEAVFSQIISLNLETDVQAHQHGHRLAFLSQFGDFKTNTSYNQQGSYQLTRNFS